MSLTASSSQRVLFQPSRSSRHRIACLALYRALVRKALQVPLDEEARLCLDQGPTRRNPIHELVRRQFRRNGDDVSKRLVFAALAAGYKFIGLLDKAQNADSSENRSIMRVLAERRHEAERSRANDLRPRRAADAPPAPAPPRPAQASTEPPSALLENHDTESADIFTNPVTPKNPLLHLVTPGTHSVAPVYTRAKPMRPTAELKSRRHIPVLVVTAIGVPFLRFGKPQPPWIDIMLRHRMLRREKFADALLSLDEEVRQAAEQEDDWEDQVRRLRRQYGVAAPDEDYEPRYVDALNEVKGRLTRLWQADTLDLGAQAHAMAEIISEERAARDEEDRQGWFFPPMRTDEGGEDATSLDVDLEDVPDVDFSKFRR